MKQLSIKLMNVPILALMDANPFGIEIMCVYRFGSNVRILRYISIVEVSNTITYKMKIVIEQYIKFS